MSAVKEWICTGCFKRHNKDDLEKSKLTKHDVWMCPSCEFPCVHISSKTYIQEGKKDNIKA